MKQMPCLDYTGPTAVLTAFKKWRIAFCLLRRCCLKSCEGQAPWEVFRPYGPGMLVHRPSPLFSRHKQGWGKGSRLPLCLWHLPWAPPACARGLLGRNKEGGPILQLLIEHLFIVWSKMLDKWMNLLDIWACFCSPGHRAYLVPSRSSISVRMSPPWRNLSWSLYLMWLVPLSHSLSSLFVSFVTPVTPKPCRVFTMYSPSQRRELSLHGSLLDPSSGTKPAHARCSSDVCSGELNR